MLGQKGPHKKKDYLKNLRSRDTLDQAFKQLMDFSKKDHRSGAGQLGQKPGFIIHDAAALYAAEQGACDIGLGYDPDYYRNMLQELLDIQSEAEMYIRRWEEGDYRTEFKTKNDLLNWIEKDLIGMPLITVNKKIGIARQRKSNLLKYLEILLYRRLKDLYRFINKDNNINYIELQIPSFEIPSQSDSHHKIESQLIQKIDESQLIEKIKEQLPPLLTKKQKQIFQLYYIEDYSAGEIAKRLKTSRSNISQIIKRIQPSLTKIKAELSTSKRCDAPVL
jgi:RNA polymerase sigma factor (sigma-70 family)